MRVLNKQITSLGVLIGVLFCGTSVPAAVAQDEQPELLQPQLIQPQQIRSKNGALNLEITLTQGTIETPCHTITTRLYKVGDNLPTSPGPTLRLNKGDNLNVHLINDLPIDASQGEPNKFRAPNTTNFHTHGLHVSPKPGHDDVLFTDINGQQELRAEFNIPKYHTSGTYWYHPHFHGSTAMQVGGGALGAIIVDDDDSDHLPPEIKALPESLIVFTQFNKAQMEAMKKVNGDTLWRAEPKSTCTGGDQMKDADSILVNGQPHPSLEIKAGQWTRLRLVNGAMMSWLDISKPANCEFQLLAKDGIYLDDAPRSVNHAVLPGGGRADIAVRCSSTGEVELESVETATRASNEFLWAGNLLTLKVTESNEPYAADLPELCYKRPCYLPDLQNKTPDANETFAMTDDATAGIFQINSQSFNISQPAYTMELESTQNFILKNINFHTFHIHISPFQLLMDGGPEDDNYFLAGDWHDTIFLPDLPAAYGDKVRVGYQSDLQEGNYVMHCHILPHEDQGMMSYIHVTGNKHLHSLCENKAEGWGPLQWGLVIGIPSFVTAVTVCTAAGMCMLKYSLRKVHRRNYERLENPVN